MKQRNTEVQKKIVADTPIFQAVRRSDFPMQIRLKMAEKGLKNVDVAERLGVSEANISRWLRGNQNLSLDTMYLLADAVEEPLTLALGSQIEADESFEVNYEAILEECTASLAGNELEAATLLEAPCAQVFDFAVYAAIQVRRSSQCSRFVRARSEYGLDGKELMVS